jgi:hypothetical protein
MATAKKIKVKKVSRAALMRQYYNGNPTATVKEVADKFKTTYSVAYMVRKEMQKKKRKIVLNLEEVQIANKLGIPTVEYATQKAEMLDAPKKPLTGKFKRIAAFTSNESVLDTINPECVKPEEPKVDPVNHPAHYKVGGIETIDFIEAKSLGYHLGNAVKYITRADHKGNRLQDLQKAKWYIDRAIEKAGA